MRPLLALALLLFSVTGASAAEPKVLRYTPSSDLSSLDPQLTTATTVGQHGLMVYDTLFSLDEDLAPWPQMVDREDIAADGLTYHFTLRPGLRFHDGQAVTGADVVASITRWMVRDTLGQKLKSMLVSFQPEGDAGFGMTLKARFPFVELALASTLGNQAIIMRRQDAETDAFKPIRTAIGSGPFRFRPDQYMAGVGAVWERNPDYVPRSEPPNGWAGGKVVKLDRVELKFIPDAATRAAALTTGEIDLIDQLPADMVPLLQRDPKITVSRISKFGSLSFIRPNQLFPPFDNVKARQALALLVHQPDYMAGYGTPEWWRESCYAWFVCGSPNGTEAGSEPYRKPDLARAKQLLAEAGYKGETIVVVGTRELPAQGMLADVTVANLQAIGVKVDFQLTDFATLVARRSSKKPPGEGGWNIIHSAINGAVLSSPATNFVVDSNCGQATYFGWPCDQTVERLRNEYMNEPDEAARRAKLEELSRALWASLPAILTGQYYTPYAWRRVVTGLLPAYPLVFWAVDKTAP